MQTIYVTGYIHGDLTEAQKDEVVESLYSIHREYLYDEETGEFSADVWILESGQKLDPFHKPPIIVRSYDEKLDDEERAEIQEGFQNFLDDSRAGNLEIEAVEAETIKDLTQEQMDAFVEYIRGRDGVSAVREKLERLNLI